MFLLVTKWWEADHQRMWVDEYDTKAELAEAIKELDGDDEWDIYTALKGEK